MVSCENLIWEHQQHCQISLVLAAEELFNPLDGAACTQNILQISMCWLRRAMNC